MTKWSTVLDTEHLRNRMIRRLVEIDKTTRSAARSANIAESTIRNLMDGHSKAPRYKTIVNVARALEVSPSWFIDSAIHEDDETKYKMKVDFTEWLEAHRIPDNLVAEKENARFNEDSIQMIYPAVKSEGYYTWKTANIFVEPPKIPITKTFVQYIFWVRSDNMYPVFRKDDKILVDPMAPLRVGEDYIFKRVVRRGENDAHFQVWLARLMSYSDTHFEIALLNPARLMRLDRKEWPKAEAVILRLFPDYDDEGETSIVEVVTSKEN